MIKKVDLKSGHGIELRDGSRYIVIKNWDCGQYKEYKGCEDVAINFSNLNDYVMLCRYSDDLKYESYYSKGLEIGTETDNNGKNMRDVVQVVTFGHNMNIQNWLDDINRDKDEEYYKFQQDYHIKYTDIPTESVYYDNTIGVIPDGWRRNSD